MPEIWCHWTNNNKKTPTKCVFECTYINVYLICIPHVCMYTSPSYGKSQSLSLMTFCTTWRDSMVTYGNINKLLITISSKCIMLINPHDPWALVTVFVVLQVLQVSIPALKKKIKTRSGGEKALMLLHGSHHSYDLCLSMWLRST